MYGNSQVPMSESLKILSEMFPAVDTETIRLMLAECGSFERTMDRLLQGDRSITWKSNKSKSAGQDMQPPAQQNQYYQQQYIPQYNHQNQQNTTSNMIQNQKYNNNNYNNNIQSPVKRPTSNPPPTTDARLFLPAELKKEMNTSLFGYLDSDPVSGGKLIRTNTKDGLNLQYNSPFSAMPVEINSRKTCLDDKKYPKWNFNDDTLRLKQHMTPSKSFDSLKKKN